MKERASGILMHISSLPGPYGIGDFGKGAYQFVDFLEQSNQKVWQILPLGTTGFGDSPYQSFSAFAGNPYFIDLDELIDLGYLNQNEIDEADLGDDPHQVAYEKLYFNKMPLLKRAYDRAKASLEDELKAYFKAEIEWVEPFALYMSIKAHHDHKAWIEWPKAYRSIETYEVKAFEKENQDEIYFWVFTQYFFSKQWKKLKGYANEKDIKIMGDLPIYVSEDSADVWASPRLFRLDQEQKPITVAGCPPDAFALTGQLWGNPIYDWDYMEDHGYQWWIKRIAYSFELFDTLRIDHFRGFEDYWEIPFGEQTAINGQWTKGPGRKLFDAIKEALGDVDIIAEDLGFLTEEVEQLRLYTGFPGMKILQFAFDSREDSNYLPHMYDFNCIAYTGTHDNETVLGWLETCKEDDKLFVIDYLKLTKEEGYAWGLIRGAWSSTANLAIAQMQDFLALGTEARMNIPSTLGGNWIWRASQDQFTDPLAEKIAAMTKLYRR